MKKILIALMVGLAIGAAFSFFATKSFVLRAFSPKIDVVTIHDTTIVYKPQIVEKRVVEKEYIPIIETNVVEIDNEIYLTEDREVVVAEDSTYRVVASGVRPSIDEIKIYSATQYITRVETKNPPRLSFGVSVGVGATYGIIGKRFDVGPTVAVGVNYRF